MLINCSSFPAQWSCSLYLVEGLIPLNVIVCKIRAPAQPALSSGIWNIILGGILSDKTPATFPNSHKWLNHLISILVSTFYQFLIVYLCVENRDDKNIKTKKKSSQQLPLVKKVLLFLRNCLLTEEKALSFAKNCMAFGGFFHKGE